MIKQTRMIGGLKFSIDGEYATKTEAQRKAEYLRKRGYRARVIYIKTKPKRKWHVYRRYGRWKKGDR